MTRLPAADLTHGLQEIRRRRRLAWIIFLAYIPVVALVYRVVPSERAALGAAIAWTLPFLVVTLRVSLARCPRCRKLFHLKRGATNPWSPRCLNCGLELEPR